MEEKTKVEVAVFGGGCFWCTEAVFKMLRGVLSVMPGYAGGKTANPTYYEVSGGKTGHAEVIQIEFDPNEISYRDLLPVFFATPDAPPRNPQGKGVGGEVFFASHDPTALNRQGNDVGEEYRSVILYITEEQKKEAEAFINELNSSAKEGKPVVTEVKPLEVFYKAEEEHRDYYERNKNSNPYCEVIIEPKLEKAQKLFAELLKTHEK